MYNHKKILLCSFFLKCPINLIGTKSAEIGHIVDSANTIQMRPACLAYRYSAHARSSYDRDTLIDDQACLRSEMRIAVENMKRLRITLNR